MQQSISRGLAVAGPSSIPSGRRAFSASASPSSFFFRRPAAASSIQLLSQLVAARKSDRLDLINKLYPALRNAAKSTPLTPASQGEFRKIMWFVADTNSPQLLLRMFEDLAMLGFTAELQDHQTLLTGLARMGKHARALRWIESMEHSHALTPTTPLWNAVLVGFRRAGDMEGIRSVVARMKARGAIPDARTYNTLLKAAFTSGDVNAARELRREMDVDGVKPDLVTAVTLLDGFLEAGEFSSAAEARHSLDEVAAEWARDRSSDIDVAVLSTIVKHECAVNGFDSGVRLAGQYRDAGLPTDVAGFVTLAQAGVGAVGDAPTGLKLVEQVEAALYQPAPREGWSLVVCHLLTKPGGLDEALALYWAARDRSVQPDSAMVHPLLLALLLPTPTTSTLETAKLLYEDLASSSRSFRLGPDAAVFGTLLRACADPEHPDFEFSARLSSDMRERRIRPDGDILTWQIVAQMRVADGWRQAFEAYDGLRAVNVDAFSTSHYNTVLAAFTSLPFPPTPDSGPPPSAYIQDILSDMRRTQHPLDSITYTLLLTFYSRKDAPSASAVAHLHSLIKVDSNLDPDITLFNALMNAYSRVGASSTAFRIWDGMRSSRGARSSGQIDNYSVSIILDTCSYAQQPEGFERGRKIWEELRRERFPVNAKNYETWIELLCRSHELDAAEAILFDELSPGAEVEGTVEIARVLLKFARRDGGSGRGAQILSRLKEERPELVPHRLTGPKDTQAANA